MKINYQRAYSIGPFLQEKIGFEVELDLDPMGDLTPATDYIETLKSLCDEAHKKLNPHLGEVAFEDIPINRPLTVQQVEKTDESVLQALENDIGRCKDLAELDTYRFVASTKPNLKEAYDKRLKELSQ